MDTLFPLETHYPEGFSFYSDFVTEEEEKALCEYIGSMDLPPMRFHQYEAKRKTASFGFDYSFEQKTLKKGKEIPVVFHPLMEKVGHHLSIPVADMGELLVTEYPVGSVINWHLDAPPFDKIIGLSLLSDCTFRLRPYKGNVKGKNAILSFPVKRRSLYLMEGSVRSNWEHSIAPVAKVRYSITIRTLKDTSY